MVSAFRLDSLGMVERGGGAGGILFFFSVETLHLLQIKLCHFRQHRQLVLALAVQQPISDVDAEYNVLALSHRLVVTQDDGEVRADCQKRSIAPATIARPDHRLHHDAHHE